MIAPHRGPTRLAFGLVVGGWLLASVVPASGQRVGWAPSRDDAVIVEEDAAVGTGLRQAADYVEEIAPSPGRRLSVPRPARLMPRTSVGRMHETAVESPAVTSTLPIPAPEYGVAGDCDSCGGDASCCGQGCGQCVDCCGNWNSCGPVPLCVLLPRPRLDTLELTAGVQAYTGPLNRGGTGSFGFHEGFNFALPLFCTDCICGQIGALWTQSNLDGCLISEDERNQTFVTAGLFHRADWGLQFGVVFDYLHDEWDYELDLGQVRGELGWRYCGCHEVGFRFASGVNEGFSQFNQIAAEGDEFVLEQISSAVEVNDTFAFYYRRQFACGGQGRLFGGFTGNQQGLVGADARVPLNACWSLAADFLYVVPSEENEIANFTEETWNVSIGLVWTPCARPGCGPSYCRPLLDVANNGSFITRVP